MNKTKNLASGVLALALLVQPAVGQEETGESCAAIAADAARLACYDGIFRSDRPASEQPTELVFESERMIPARPSGRAAATFSVACAPEGPEVRFGFANQLLSATGDVAPVTLQVDQGPTTVRTMAASEDNVSLSFASAQETATFLDSLSGGDLLRVRMTPVRQRSVNVTFRLEDAVPQIEALRVSCN